MNGTSNPIALELSSGGPVDARTFRIVEAIHGLFEATVEFVSRDPELTLEALTGTHATLRISGPRGDARWLRGVVANIEQLDVLSIGEGLSTYELTLVPELWLLTQRTNFRVFQAVNELAIVDVLLDEWGIVAERRLLRGPYLPRELRVQYGETDFHFLCRMLEEIGATFVFDSSREGSPLVLHDAVETTAPKDPPLPWLNEVMGRPGVDFVTDMIASRLSRPGRYVQRDWDARRSELTLEATHEAGLSVERAFERFHFNPGGLRFLDGPGVDLPTNDDRGKFRPHPGAADAQAETRLVAKQSDAVSVSLRTSAARIAPGAVISISGHPREEASGEPLLVVEAMSCGRSNGDFHFELGLRPASARFVPPQRAHKPRVTGLEAATVVGPDNQEIHVDELGRVRVRFHWERSNEGPRGSAWLPCSQPWAGDGFGMVALPRVGHEVLVDFLCGDPEQPVVIGRLHTAPNPTVYTVPEHATRSGLRSRSSPGGQGFNELMFEDRLGEELLHVQAEKDATTLIKRDAAVVTRRDLTVTVGRDESRAVLGARAVRVAGHRRQRVERDARSWIDREVYEASTSGVVANRSKGPTHLHAGEQAILSVGRSALAGGLGEAPMRSFIVIERDRILIQSDLVDLNPHAASPAPPPRPPPLTRADAGWVLLFGESGDGR